MRGHTPEATTRGSNLQQTLRGRGVTRGGHPTALSCAALPVGKCLPGGPGEPWVERTPGEHSPGPRGGRHSSRLQRDDPRIMIHGVGSRQGKGSRKGSRVSMADSGVSGPGRHSRVRSQTSTLGHLVFVDVNEEGQTACG